MTATKGSIWRAMKQEPASLMECGLGMNPLVKVAIYPYFKVTGYLCTRRVKCIGKCILKLANQKFWRWRCAVTRCRA